MDMRHIFYHFILPVIALIAVSCGSRGSVSDDITVAERAVMRGDYTSAKSISDGIFASCDSTMTVSDLCRLSIVYMKLSDIADVDDNTAAATTCYRIALKVDPDSARIFFRNLPVEDTRHAEVISTLEQLIDDPRELDLSTIDTSYIDSDSIPVE